MTAAASPKPGVSRRHLLQLAAVVLVAGGANAAWQAWTATSAAGEIVARAAPGDIEMLSSASCVYCAEARRWFTAHRVPFRECIVESDAACATRFRALLAPGTPVLLVRGRHLIGFQPQRVAEALRAAS